MSKRKLFHGTMNASKSAQLLMQAYNLERQGKKFIIFKPMVDVRDGNFVRSRALNEKRPAIAIEKFECGVMFDTVRFGDYDFVFVDEIQFFSPQQVEELSKISIKLDKPVFAYGLLISYTGEMFEATKKAVECGFTLHELKMQCDFCDSKSTHHLLYIDGQLVTEGSGIHVGDQEYKSVCYPCFKEELDKNKK